MKTPLRLFAVVLCLVAAVLGTACAESADSEPSATAVEEASGSPAEELLGRSIAFHDPGSQWENGAFRFALEESRPDGTVRHTEIAIDNGNGRFHLESQREGRPIAIEVHGDEVSVLLDGAPVGDPVAAERLRLDDAGALRTRNYYLYLYGLPMKLRDPGTHLGKEVVTTEFDGQPALELRVSYDPEVGSDTWYFYFAPDEPRLIGYRFYHDENAGDGEYILLEDLADVGALRLPKRRTWYTHQGDELLGTDTVVGGGGGDR